MTKMLLLMMVIMMLILVFYRGAVSTTWRHYQHNSHRKQSRGATLPGAGNPPTTDYVVQRGFPGDPSPCDVIGFPGVGIPQRQ